MLPLFKIKAKIKIHTNSGRTWPVKNGYRPGFIFKENGQTSGAINLINYQELCPGEIGDVEIFFVSDILLGELCLGQKFTFNEGPIEIGEGEIIDIIGWVENPLNQK